MSLDLFLNEVFAADDAANAEFERHMRSYKPKSSKPASEEKPDVSAAVRDYVTKRIEGLCEGIVEMSTEDREHIDGEIAKLAKKIDLLRADLMALRVHVNSDGRTYERDAHEGLLPHAVAEADEEVGDVIELPNLWSRERDAA
jgi:hypothetical protein